MENQKITALQNLFNSRLDTLSHLLEAAQSHFADGAESVLQQRIAPDMFPFGTQIARHSTHGRSTNRQARLYDAFDTIRKTSREHITL